LKKISELNRKRKWKLFLNLIKPDKDDTILDVGFNETEYSHVDNFLEKNYQYPEKITALGLKEANEFAYRYPKVNTVKYDGRIFPFGDKNFDICWSNAVLEHVGNREKQIFFIKEITRVSKSAYITTPNIFFPIEVHTRVPLLHYLPKKIFDKILPIFGKSWATGNYMHLLSKKELKDILKEAGVSSYRIIENKLLFFTLDFVIIWGEKTFCSD